MLYNLTNNLKNVSKFNEYADGYRVHRPSDDPVAVGKMMRLKTNIMDNEQYTLNTQDAVSFYEVTENTIDGIQDMVKRLKSLGVQAANTATATPDDLEKINSEVVEIIDSLIKSGNFNFAGKYIFSGFKSDRKLLDNDGNYNIDITDTDIMSPQQMRVFVGQRELIETSTNGLDIFGSVVDGGVYQNMYTNTAGSNYPEGISSVQGKFALDIDHSSEDLNISINGVEFEVNESLLDGSSVPLNRDTVLSAFKNALNAGSRLDDVAKVYFDKNDNLVIRAINPAEAVEQVDATTTYKTASTTEGISAKKSILRGSFILDGPQSDYRSANFVATVNGVDYKVDTSTMTGNGFDLKKADVLKQFRSAQAQAPATGSLSDVADVFFDQSGSLVIKEKNFGANTMTFTGGVTGYNPSFKAGNNVSEASVEFSSFPLNDAYVLNHLDELKSTPIYVTLNGIRKRVDIDDAAVINDVATYTAALQNAIGSSFGAGRITASISGGHIKLETANTPIGEKPSIKVEPVVTKTPSLIKELKEYSAALLNADNDAITAFLDKLSAHEDRILAVRASIGAKYNRVKLIESRNEDDNLSFIETLTNVGGVDMQKAILEFKQFDAVYKASLSISSKIIQPSLVDFLR